MNAGWLGGRVVAGALLAIGILHCRAADWGFGSEKAVPPGAVVTLETDRREYFIGENVLVHFTLHNKSDKPFEAGFGGDYRGASRHLRFKVTAVDQRGQAAEDPDPSGVYFGGIGGSRELKPGETFTQSLPLLRYRRIMEPGEHVITATHDFGWNEEGGKRPVGEIRLRFRVPSLDEAEEVIARMEKLPVSADSRFGERTPDYADFTSLYHPVYLQPLQRKARAEDVRALDGISRIATVEATSALFQLAGERENKLASDAAALLGTRLPDPALRDARGFGGFGPFTKKTRKQLVSKAWDPKFIPGVRSLATNYLAGPGAKEIAVGAFMIQAVGMTNDAAATTAALGRALDPLVTPRRDPRDNILDDPQPVRELVAAMRALHERGYILSEGALNGEAEILLYFDQLAGKPGPRSPRWIELVEAFGPNTRFPTRTAVLHSIPQPMPEGCVAFVKGRLADTDAGVCRAACTVAGKSGNKTFLQPLLEMIATENHEWLLREATKAAQQLGAGYELLEVWADRLAEERLYPLALDSLQTVIEGLPGSSSGRTDLSRGERLELRRAWRNFLQKHGDELRAGKKFPVNSPALTPALFGRARSWQLENGNSWPAVAEANQ